uniref:Uncharacterized protein n=1 Tax=Nonomuraea gerenzanensis TaxID=93944 RepID=A0A1M4EQ90_9ACTN|nr:hypothetical protein BN4615_P10547 [Nonomuraea gerenzanensis]
MNGAATKDEIDHVTHPASNESMNLVMWYNARRRWRFHDRPDY